MVLGFTNKMCPLGVDQTCRSTQLWTVMVPALEEQYDMGVMKAPGMYGSDPTALMKSKRNAFAWGAFNKLAQPQRRPGTATIASMPIGMCRTQGAGDSALERLPAELLAALFANRSLSPQDLFSLALSSQTLWTHLIFHLSRQSARAPWAGTPLLCTGTYLTTVPQTIHDLHPEMKQEEYEFAEQVNNALRRKPLHGPGQCPARNFNWAAREDFTDRSKVSSTQEMLQAFKEVSKMANICACDSSLLLSSLSRALFTPSGAKPSRGRPSRDARRCRPYQRKAPVPTWTLRNLTTSEYVVLSQRKTKGKSEDYVHVKGLIGLSLDKLLILRTSWSSHSTRVQPAQVASKQLVSWAGHRFDVVRSAEVASKAAWRDVTAAVVLEAKALK